MKGGRRASWRTRILRLGMATLFTASSCVAWGRDIVLEERDVAQWSLTQTGDNANVVLRISGLVFHSSLGIESIEQSKEGDTLAILVRLRPAGPTASGNLAFDVALPGDVQTVVFGRARTQIWRRRAVR